MIDERALHAPRGLVLGERALAALEQRVHHLAVDVELELLGREVADAYREARLVPGEPSELELRGEPADVADGGPVPEVPRGPQFVVATTGMPAAFITSLAFGLFIASAEARMPLPPTDG